MMPGHRLLLAALLAFFCAQAAQAEITFAIGEPAEGSTKSGVGLVSGWAISDRGIASIEAFIDGESIGPVPYGSARGDVAAAFPDVPGSLHSGWGMKWAYPLLADGEHELTIVVTEQGGATASRSVTFEVVGFASEFIADPASVRTAGAIIESPEDGRIVVSGAEVEGEAVDIELAWDTASQQFLVDTIRYPDRPKTNEAPSADAGADLAAQTGDRVSVTGHGADPDGQIVNRRWSQVSGPAVVLDGADQWTVAFEAPASAGSVRLRLTVTDDGGLSASDEVTVLVQEPANQSPSADAGPDFTVESGAAASIRGEGSDPDGSIVSWRWSRSGGLAVALIDATSRTVRFTAPTGPGEIRLWLTVTDDDGATAHDEVVVTVLAPPVVNRAPSANAGPDMTVEAGSTVTLTGGGSDPDGSIVAWSWAQVEGPGVALSGAGTRNVTFTAPAQSATLRLRLTVTDDDGATGADEVVVTVEAAATDTTTGSKLPSMLTWINEARAVARTCGTTDYPAQPALQWSESLAEIATIHSMDMARNAYFAHDSLDGTSMGERVFPYWSGTRVGENIAASSHDRSDEYVVQMWLDSPGHCALIMDPNFTHAGIGVGRDPGNGWDFHHFWTVDFGG